MMYLINIMKTFFGGLLLLIVEQALAAPQDLPVKTISIPAYNMIADTLQSIAPTVNGKRNDFIMQQICALARGDKTQQEVDGILKEKNVDISSINQAGPVASLLINGDKEQQQMACALYLATSLYEPVNIGVYFTKKKSAKNTDTKKESSSWRFWDSDKEEQNKVTAEQVVFNEPQFINDAQVKMAIVQATAQMYAVIAENIQGQSNQYWSDYHQRIAAIVYNYSSEYLRKINVFYKSGMTKNLKPVNVSLNSYTVANDAGDMLTQQDGNLLFTEKGVPWFGNGKILGKEYFADVVVINPVAQMSQTEDSVKKDVTEKNAGHKKKSSKS
ncbi:TPA: hypothetical protein ACOEMI_004572 [Enterobacter ludwigii]